MFQLLTARIRMCFIVCKWSFMLTMSHNWYACVVYISQSESMLKNLPVVQVRMNARSLAAIILYLCQCSYPFVYLFLILGKWQLERITPTSKWQHRKERVGEALVSLITRLKLALILSLNMKLKFIFINDWLFFVSNSVQSCHLGVWEPEGHLYCLYTWTT